MNINVRIAEQSMGVTDTPATKMMYKFGHRNFAWVVCMNVVVFMQTALAAFEPTGKLVKDGMERGSAKYIVGNEKIALSRENYRIYKNAVVGDAAAQCEFAKILNPSIEPDDATPRVAAEAFAWAMKSANQGYADGENYVGMSYKEGEGVPKDVRESEKWLTKAVEHGSAKAMCNLAILYIENGEAEKAVKFARKSALNGYAEGQVQWGRMNLLGQGVPVDAKKAVGWFVKAAKQDNIRAMALLATCYQQGNGTEKDISKAIGLYEKIADRKDDTILSVIAKAALAGIYFEDETAIDNALAVKWAFDALQDGGLEALARAGEKPLVGTMEYIIGLSFYKGKGVNQNDKLAKHWLERAVVWGSARAKTALVEMAEEKRIREERAIAAKKEAEEAEKRRREEERRRIAERERQEREERLELARQQREERAREILENAKKEYYEEKAREKWIELRYPEAIDAHRQFRDRWNAERMRMYQQGYW